MLRQIITLSLVQQLLVLLARVSAVDAANLTPVGCYSSSGSLVFNETFNYQTQSYCQGLCTPMGDSVLGLTNGGDCWCGNAIPSGKVDSSYCNVPCNGYGLDDCGGYGYYTVFLTGVGTLKNPNALTSSSSVGESATSTSTSSSTSSVTSSESSSSSDVMSTPDGQSTTIDSSSFTTSTSGQSIATATTSVTTGLTVTTTVSASQSSTGGANSASAGSSSANSGNSRPSHGISGGGIAGIVIGVIAGLAIIAALVFFIRRRRRNNNDDDWSDYHGGKGKLRGLRGRSSNNNPIVAPAMPHEKLSSNSFNSGRVAIVDQRLNPVMMERRLSDGSLSDEQDYSRKILRVVNMD
ncbi:uncharacterized protein V1513DRAFT_57229 [Lipomyces chichibuensis]|uniref:uncharacterized protein n=1 Tax=Lipomyces chichibuensis TaxID=1546026 RepID=UPI003342FC34